MWDWLLSRFRRRGRSSSTRTGRTRSWLSGVLAPGSGAHGGTAVVAPPEQSHPPDGGSPPWGEAAAAGTAGRSRQPSQPAAGQRVTPRPPAVSPADRSQGDRSQRDRPLAAGSLGGRSPAGTRRQRPGTQTRGRQVRKLPGRRLRKPPGRRVRKPPGRRVRKLPGRRLRKPRGRRVRKPPDRRMSRARDRSAVHPGPLSQAPLRPGQSGVPRSAARAPASGAGRPGPGQTAHRNPEEAG